MYPLTHSQINKTGNQVAPSMEKAGEFLLTTILPTSLKSLSLKAETGQTKSLSFRRRLGMRPPENLNLQKSVENEQMCPGVLKEWVDVIARTLSMAVEKLWQSKSSVTGGKKKPNKTKQQHMHF